MANTFLRKYQLSLLSPIRKETSNGGGSISSRKKTQDGSTGYSVLYTLDSYRLQASLRFSSSGVSSTADSHIISIYNAPDNLIKTLRESFVKVELKAGYENDNGISYSSNDSLPIIFVGEKVKSKTYKDGLNTVTDIFMSTALTEKREAISSELFLKSEPLPEFLRKLTSPINIPTTIVLDAVDSVKSLRKDLVVHGATATELQRICNSYGLVHWYQNEQLYIGSPNALSLVNPKNTLFKIDSGRIKGVVNWTTDDSIKSVDQDSSLKADFTTFLIPNMTIGSSVELEIEGVIVTLVVTSFEHELDTHGDSWDTRIVAEAEVR